MTYVPLFSDDCYYVIASDFAHDNKKKNDNGLEGRMPRRENVNKDISQ